MPQALSRKYSLALAGLLLCGAASAAWIYVLHQRPTRPAPGDHVFELSARPGYLSEELALTYARESLRQAGLNPADWRPVPTGRRDTPDAQADRYLARTAGTRYRGVIAFTREGRSLRFVAVELQGARVVCQNSPGK